MPRVFKETSQETHMTDVGHQQERQSELMRSGTVEAPVGRRQDLGF